jgi:signal transduction histidine kinase
MRQGSLRLRLIAGGVLALLAALTIAGGGLIVLFERHIARTIADDLNIHLNQLLSAIDVSAAGELQLLRSPSDPRFNEPLSGLYWQLSDDGGQLLRSRSLWDTTLPLPVDNLSPGEVHLHEIVGPAGADVLVAERSVGLTVGDQRVPVRVAVAADLARVSAATAAFARDLIMALALLGLVLAIATAVQVALGLRPLDSLRRAVIGIRASGSRHLPAAVPLEVQPLVEEINALLDEQEREIERSRSRAADLAHGLKTPLAALAADVRRLKTQGQEDIARDIESLGEAMSRHVDRELARARARGAVRQRAGLSTVLAPLVQSLIATLARAPCGAGIAFEPHMADDLAMPFDRADLAEVLGNLLENAARHAKSRVSISASAEPAAPSIVIEDDGPGIAETARSRVIERGVRLDQRDEGAGLGLAIVQDVLDAYGWRCELAGSDRLGGLRVTIAPGSVRKLERPDPTS